MPTSSPIKTAVIGYGFSAKTFHLPFIHCLERYQFTALSTSKIAEAQENYSGVALFADPYEMLTQSDADLVVITAPNDVHFSLAKFALEQGKHVLLEKPFVTQEAQGEELIALAAANKRVLSVYQNRRWDGDFLTVKQLIESGQLGQVRFFESHFDRFRPQVRQRWREIPGEGSGVFYDLAPHMVDQCLALFGDPSAVTAECRSMRENSETNDFFHLLLHYPDKLVQLHASLFCASPNLRFNVQGDKANYVKYGLDPQEDRLKAGVKPDTLEWAKEHPEQYGMLYTADRAAPFPTRTGGYQEFYTGLAAAIVDGALPPVTAEQALVNIRIIELALQSSTERRTLEYSPSRASK